MKTTKSRPLYSQRFLERYGRGLKREEISLVQGYRGLSRGQRAGLILLVSEAILDNTITGRKAAR